LAKRREIDTVLATELSSRGRSTMDLPAALKELEARRMSVIALKTAGIRPLDTARPHNRGHAGRHRRI
jgi:DNA invertase Pin-like site-specific DNA recombinase